MLHIGHCIVHNTTQELECYFDGSGHSWTGPKVSIKSIEFKLKCEVNATIQTKGGGITANVGFTVIAVIRDEKGRFIERTMSGSKFKERFSSKYQSGSYLIGWSDGENKIVLNDTGESFMNGVSAQAS